MSILDELREARKKDAEKAVIDDLTAKLNPQPKVKSIDNPLESIFNAIVFDSKDYSYSKRDAWIYGIVVGWDDDSIKELSTKFNWDDSEVFRLKMLNLHYLKLSKGIEENDR